MRPRAVALIVVAFVLGALAAGSIGVRVIREVRTADDATSLPAAETTTTAPAAVETATYQVDPRETLISSTALVPMSLEVGGSGLAIGYDLVTLSPYAGVDPIEFFGNFGVVTVIDNTDLDHIYPRAWEVETTDGTLEGGPANTGARIARFPVDDGFSISEIRSVSITDARAPYALDVPLTISQAEPRVEVVPGVVVELLNVSDQGDTAIVQIGIDIADHDLASFFVTGDGPGWRSAVFEAEGRPRVNLTWVGGAIPDEFDLVATGTIWVQIPGTFPVTLEGL